MTECQAESLFRKYKKDMIKKLGRTATTDAQLTCVGKELFGKRYIGTFSQDTIPFGRSGMLIANTDPRNKPGKHWVAMVTTPKTIYVYDSYGRPTSKLLKILTKNAKDRNIKIVDSDTSDAEQRNSDICGALCLSFLLVVKSLGVLAAIKI